MNNTEPSDTGFTGGTSSQNHPAFHVDTDEKADWAIGKIREAIEERDRLQTLYDTRITRSQEKREAAGRKAEEETAWLMAELASYMRTVKTRRTKTQQTYQLPAGKLIQKEPRITFDRDDAVLLAWLNDAALDAEYTRHKMVTTIAWDKLKPDITILEDGILMHKGSGLIIEGLRWHTDEVPLQIKFEEDD